MFAILKNMKRIVLTGLLTVIAGISLAACGGDAAPAAAPQPTNTVVSQSSNAVTDAAPTKVTTDTMDVTADAEVQEVQLVIKEWAIEPSNITLKPGKVRFTVTNTGQFSHNVTVKDGGATLGATPTFGPAEGIKTFEVDLQAGTYGMLCSLPGHEAQGQRGTITVK